MVERILRRVDPKTLKFGCRVIDADVFHSCASGSVDAHIKAFWLLL